VMIRVRPERARRAGRPDQRVRPGSAGCWRNSIDGTLVAGPVRFLYEDGQGAFERGVAWTVKGSRTRSCSMAKL